MISLGCHDQGVGVGDLDRFFAEVRRVSGDEVRRLRGDKGLVGLAPIRSREPLRVAEIQEILKNAAFLPGGRVDGICGYRTQAAIRLFQEYVRATEKRSCLPDGIVGPQTAKHLRRWADGGLAADWASTHAEWKRGGGGSDEFNAWVRFLGAARDFLKSNTTPMLQLVNDFRGKSDTARVADWNVDPGEIHLIGIRVGEQDRSRKFDDVLVLLIRGLVFKFQGSTDPGYTRNENGAPFLVQGQHDFRFGLHRRTYHALRPLSFESNGVLVVRSKGDYALTEADIRRGLEINGTINIHWGGKGVGRAVNRWSEGCQVIAGSGYQDHRGKLTSCADYVAINNGEVSAAGKNKTRGAYNVLCDLIAAFSTDVSHPGLVRYTLLHEADLAIDCRIEEIVATTREGARRFMAKLA